MNGAESLVHTLLKCGVDTCFANPGTSEMHFVAALDRIPGMRCVLGLFEGVVTGAADGYARMAGKPAATLLHCGPGLANGLANLHNAQARTHDDGELSSAIRRPIIVRSIRRLPPTPKAGRAASPVSCVPPKTPPMSAARRRRRSRPRKPRRGTSRR